MLQIQQAKLETLNDKVLSMIAALTIQAQKTRNPSQARLLKKLLELERSLTQNLT
jgi:hypothetical protein